MNEKCLILGVCFLVLVAGAANAETYTWDGTENNTWEDETHWNPEGGPPTLSDQANLLSGTCDVTTMGASALVVLMGFGVEDLTTTVDINANAKLTTDSEIVVGFYAGTNTNAVLDIHGTGSFASLRIAGEEVGSMGTMNIDGGLCNVTAFGTYIGTRWDAGHEGFATINISNGGVFKVDGLGAYGNRLDIGANSVINVLASGGTIQVKGPGSVETQLQGFLDTGKIVGEGDCVLFYDSESDYTYYMCGPVCMTYLDTDVNTDCYVDLKDLAVLAANWLDCTAIGDPECSP